MASELTSGVSNAANRSVWLAVCVIAAGLTSSHIDVRQRWSLSALSEIASMRLFRMVEPQLSLALPYAGFRSPASREPDGKRRRLSSNTAKLFDLTAQPAVPLTAARIHAAGVAHLLLGEWNNAVGDLARTADRNPAYKLDAAAAYYMRGLATGSLNDFARALQELSDAPIAPAVTFNRALIFEQLCDREAAAAEWRSYLDADRTSPWASEARDHLRKDTLPTAAQAWITTKPALIEAAQRNDRRRVDTITDAYRLPARKLIELELLPQWAEQWRRGARGIASRTIATARVIASSLSARTGERLLTDAVAEIDRAIDADHRVASRLAMIYPFYGQGRQAIEKGDYSHAADLLDRAASLAPLGSAAGALIAIQSIRARYYQYDYAAANRIIDETAARYGHREDDYIALFGQIAWLRGLIQIASGDASGALQSYESALVVFDRLGELDYQAGQHTNIADALAYLGETERAAAHRRRALLIAEQLDDSRRLHAILSEAADAALALPAPAAAFVFQDRLLRLARRSRDPLQIADALTIRSTILRQNGQRSAALHDLTEATVTVGHIVDMPTRQRLLADIGAAEAFAYRDADDGRVIRSLTRSIDLFRGLRFNAYVSQLLLERGRARIRTGEMSAAEQDFRDGIAEFERQRDRVDEAELRIAYFDRAEVLFIDLAVFLIRRGRAEEAFNLLERARARELLDASTLTQLKPLPTVEIQRQLPADVVLIAFTVTPRSLVTSVMTRDALRVFEQDGGEATLQPLVDAVSAGFGSNATLPRAGLQRLADALLGPIHIPDEGQRIIFVPDGILYRVPFAALLESGHYLVERHAIGIAPGATLFVRNVEHDRLLASHGPRSILLLASGEGPSGYESLLPLTHAPEQAARIAGLYPSHRLLLGSDDQARSFLTIGRDYDVIDFAGHAIVNQRSPAASSLLVGKNGRIPAAEIEASRLTRVRLVVLGGCGTGVGETRRSEGALSLARAFMAAGVPSVVGTIASVDDRAAAELLARFHAAYVHTLDPAEALRLAQLQMLRSHDPAFADPARWSVFQVVGGACSTPQERKEKRLWATHRQQPTSLALRAK